MARGAFWTIIVDDQPTAFRAPVREDLLPTLKQLQRQHPTAVIKWFQRGRLWETPGDAMDASKPPRRAAGWRPGGEHKDPRDAYKVPRDVKRARWASQAAEGRGPWVKGKDGNAERRTPNAERGERPAWKPRAERADGPPKPRGEGGWKPGSDRPAFKPRSERPEDGGGFTAKGDRPAWKPKGDRPTGDRPAWKPKSDRADGPPKPRGEGGWKPKGDRPAFKPRSERPEGSGGFTPKGDRPAWKPKGDRPTGDRPAWKPKSDRADGPPRPRGEGGWKPRGEGKDQVSGTGSRAPEARGERPAWKPKGDRPAFKPRSERPEGGGGFTPKGDRPAWKPSGPGIRRGSGTGAPRDDWRERSARADARPRAGGDAPKPAAKRGKTWRVGELPPADRKKKKED